MVEKEATDCLPCKKAIDYKIAGYRRLLDKENIST